MSEETNQNDAPEISDEHLNDVAGGDGKTFSNTTIMTWDNTKHTKATDVAIEELTIAVERIEKD